MLPGLGDRAQKDDEPYVGLSSRAQPPVGLFNTHTDIPEDRRAVILSGDALWSLPLDDDFAYVDHRFMLNGVELLTPA